MRLIDANALERRIVEMTREPAYQHTGEDWLNGLCMAMEAVNYAPTVYAVEVVRCKDCIYWWNDEETYPNHCGKHGVLLKVYKDDFCSSGERKDNGTV